MAISLAYASPLARGFKRANSTAPAVNVKESEKAYTMELAAPGIKKEYCRVAINDEGRSTLVACKARTSPSPLRREESTMLITSMEGTNRSTSMRTSTITICAASSATRTTSRATRCLMM